MLEKIVKKVLRFKDSLLKHRRILIVLAHIFFIVSAYILAFYIRFDFKIPQNYIQIIFNNILYLIIIKIIVFWYFDLYSGLWRYASMGDLFRIFKANIIATIGFSLYILFFVKSAGFPRSLIIIDFILCVAFVGGVRFLSRAFREHMRFIPTLKTKKVLIVGAGEAGILVVKELRNNPHMNFEIVGFIDDALHKRNSRIHNIKIFGDRNKISEVVSKYGVEEIIIAIPSAKGEVIRDIISCAQVLNVKVKIVPGFHKILNGEVEIKIREVKPEDLLGRETVDINKDEVQAYIKNRKILVTGGCGSIGSELCRQIASFSPEQIVIFDHNENDMYFLELEMKEKYSEIAFIPVIGDVKDISLLKYTFSKYNPQVVFHAAAFKHVPLMEQNPTAAVKNNIIVTRNLIYASEHYGVERFVFISTDKAVNPTSIMGATKCICEMILQAKAEKSRTKFMAVRFGNVLGSKGSVIPLFKKQIEEGGPITITHPEVKRYFMSVKEAVQLVLQASAIGKGGEIFVLDMGEQIKIIDLAKNLITLSGLKLDKDIVIKYTGLRPGEKLYEELMYDGENDKATKYNKIFVSHPRKLNIKELRKQIKTLEHLAKISNNEEIIKNIQEAIPSYKPYIHPSLKS